RSASFLRVSASRSASFATWSARSSARPTVSAAIRLRFATHQPNTAAPRASVMIALIRYSTYCSTRDVLSLRRGRTPFLRRAGTAAVPARVAPRAGEGPRGSEKEGNRKRKGPALPCGEVDEPAQAGGTAQ